MGQRLVVNVICDDKQIASLYFHWSAYSVSAIEEAKWIISAVEDHNVPKDIRLRLLDTVQLRGGCVSGGQDGDEFKAVQEMYPNLTLSNTGSRNEGLIAFSEEGMARLNGWAEASIELDFDTRTVYNSVFYVYDDPEEFECDFREDFYEVPERDLFIDWFNFDECDYIIEQLEDVCRQNYRYRRSEIVYGLIA